MPESKGRIANKDFVTAFTADQTGVFIRWMCAAMSSVLELTPFRSRTATMAKQRANTEQAVGYASDVNLTNPAPSAV